MHIDYKVKDRLNSNELIAVFKAVGWQKDPDNIVEAFDKAYYMTARVAGRLIGFVRVISDGYYYANIFDLVVIPEYQRKGIASSMMTEIKDQFDGMYLFLTYTEGHQAFYEKCGFKVNNAGMWISK